MITFSHLNLSCQCFTLPCSNPCSIWNIGYKSHNCWDIWNGAQLLTPTCRCHCHLTRPNWRILWAMGVDWLLWYYGSPTPSPPAMWAGAPRMRQCCRAPYIIYLVPRDLIVTLPRGDFDSCRMSSGSSRACNDFISTLMNELWFWVIFIMRIFVWDSPLSTMSAMMMMMMLHSRSNSSCSNNFENHMNFRQNAAPTLCIVRRKNTCFLLYFTDIISLSYSLFVWLANQCAALWGARLLESWACWNYY